VWPRWKKQVTREYVLNGYFDTLVPSSSLSLCFLAVIGKHTFKPNIMLPVCSVSHRPKSNGSTNHGPKLWAKRNLPSSSFLSFCYKDRKLANSHLNPSVIPHLNPLLELNPPLKILVYNLFCVLKPHHGVQTYLFSFIHCSEHSVDLFHLESYSFQFCKIFKH
jgi:hypothetical protein